MVFGLPIGTVFQGVNVAVLLSIAAVLGYWIKGMPERGRVKNEASVVTAKIEEDLRGEAAVRFQEFRDEVHGLRNELGVVLGKLQQSEARSMRRADKLRMVTFILGICMDALEAIDPGNKGLAQARRLLQGLEDEPRNPDNSSALNAAEDTVDNAKATVREVKASEAKTSEENIKRDKHSAQHRDAGA